MGLNPQYRGEFEIVFDAVGVRYGIPPRFMHQHLPHDRRNRCRTVVNGVSAIPTMNRIQFSYIFFESDETGPNRAITGLFFVMVYFRSEFQIKGLRNWTSCKNSTHSNSIWSSSESQVLECSHGIMVVDPWIP